MPFRNGSKRMLEQRRNQDVNTGRFIAGNRAAVAARGTPKKKLLSDQLRKELEKVDGTTGLPLYQLVAAKLVDLAVNGSLDTIKEIFDRIEGKPRMAVEFRELERAPKLTKDMTIEEAMRAYAALIQHGDDYIYDDVSEEEPSSEIAC
jgi:hypothetical protein